MRPEYQEGARNAVDVCMGVRASDRVAVVRDRQRMDIAAAVIERAEGAGAPVRAWTVEDVAPRPLLELPDALAGELRAFAPTVSYFVAGSDEGELAFRMPLIRLLVDELACRHGHMVGIDDRVMREGMAVDYEEVYRVTRRVYDVVRGARRIEVTTALGTDLVATFSPELRWVPLDGRYHGQSSFGNLPEGECFTSPAGLDGVLVGESMGDHFSERYGQFAEPAWITVEDGWVREATVPGHPGLEAEIRAYLAQHPNSSRTGEFAIGTNVGLEAISGNFLQDEKIPGVHVAFGDPYGNETGADWSAPSHVDVLATRATVTVDGERIMEDGAFLI